MYAWLTTIHYQLINKMISKYVPQAPTSTSEIYCQLIKDIKNIKVYDSFADFMESKMQHDTQSSPEFLINYMKFVNIINQQVRYSMSKDEHDEENDNELVRDLKIKHYHSIEEDIESNIGERRDYMIYLWGETSHSYTILRCFYLKFFLYI